LVQEGLMSVEKISGVACVGDVHELVALAKSMGLPVQPHGTAPKISKSGFRTRFCENKPALEMKKSMQKSRIFFIAIPVSKYCRS